MPPEKTQQDKSNNPLLEVLVAFTKELSTFTKKEEVAQIVKTLLEAIKDMGERMSGDMADTKGELENTLTELSRRLDTVSGSLNDSIQQSRATSDESLNTAIKQLREEVKRVQGMIPKLPDYTEQFMELESKIPTIPEKDAGEDMRNALEALPDGDKLAIDAIQDLRKELNALKQIRTSGGDGGGIVGRDLVRNYDLSEHLDGATKTFNLPAIWSIVSVATSSFPNVLRPVIDYTYTGQSITFTDEIDAPTTLASGQTVVLTIVSA